MAHPVNRTAAWKISMLAPIIIPLLLLQAPVSGAIHDIPPASSQNPPITEFAVASGTDFIAPSPVIHEARKSVPKKVNTWPDESADLESIIDKIMAAKMDSFAIAGAVVAVVRDGKQIFSKGYGKADTERGIPVDPEKTLFRIGSVTKLFTWVAVMQLRDAGKLDLDADVNQYLDFSLPYRFGEPVTLRHLMTHTPGFEDRLYGIFGNPGNETTGSWLARYIPKQMWPPGRHVAYSNYGTTLAGYIVERISNMEWEDYVETHILAPLNMHAATTRQPVPEHLEPYISRGYRFRNNRFEPQPFELIEIHAAAGGLSASADAMSSFMKAMLPHPGHQTKRDQPDNNNLSNESHSGGSTGQAGYGVHNPQILSQASIEELFTRSGLGDPRINGVCLGFMEMSSHGLRIVGHGGSTNWFHTDLALIPEKGIGIFTSFNSEEGALPGLGMFRHTLLNEIYPDWLAVHRTVRQEPLPDWEKRASALKGNYVLMRRPFTTFDKMLGAVISRMTVIPSNENPGEITLQWMLGETNLIETEPAYFVEPDGLLEIAFKGSAEEGYNYIYNSFLPMFTGEKERISDSLFLRLGLLAFCLLILLSLPIAMMLHFLILRIIKKHPPRKGEERWFPWFGTAFTVLSFLFVVLLPWAIGGQHVHLSAENRTLMQWILLLPVVSMPVAAFLIYAAVKAFRKGYWSLPSRIHFALFTLAALVFIMQLSYWNLLGWNL